MEQFFLLGDIHGDFYCLEKFCRKNGNKEPIKLIQIGDFGAGFSTTSTFVQDMDYLNKILAEFNVTLYVIRGNHDDPEYFDGGYNFWSNLKFMPDYSVIEINNKKILLVGGAISIDRKSRNQDIDWWVDEVFTFDEEKIKSFTNIDCVVTHTAPDFCHPKLFNNFVYNFAKNDDTLLTELIAERELLTKMYNILNKKNKIEKWFYGHFHTEKHQMYGKTQFNLLSINQYYKYE